MKLDTSAAPELALLAAPPAITPAVAPAPAGPGSGGPGTGVPSAACPAGQPGAEVAAGPEVAARPVTVGYLAACLRLLVADPGRWWDLVRFDPRSPLRIPVGAPAHGCETWLVVLPPGYHGEVPGQPPRGGVSCLVAGTVIEQGGTTGERAGAAGGWQDRPLSPGRIRVHGGAGPARLINSGVGYAVTLHARPDRPARTRAA
jgi:hypothetical protein